MPPALPAALRAPVELEDLPWMEEDHWMEEDVREALRKSSEKGQVGREKEADLPVIEEYLA